MKQLFSNKFALLSATMLISISVLSGQELKESRTYPVKDFNKIYLEGAYRVYLIQGNAPALEIRASDTDVFDYVEVDNNESNLKLKITKKHFDLERVTLYITFKDLEAMVVEGGIRLKTKGYINLKDFYLGVEGGASIDMDLNAKSVEISGKGGVLFELNGETGNLDVKLEGAGHVDASELQAETVNFSIEGVGTGSVYATKELNARLKGVGKILYRGNPVINKSIDGLGTVSKD